MKHNSSNLGWLKVFFAALLIIGIPFDGAEALDRLGSGFACSGGAITEHFSQYFVGFGPTKTEALRSSIRSGNIDYLCRWKGREFCGRFCYSQSPGCRTVRKKNKVTASSSVSGPYDGECWAEGGGVDGDGSRGYACVYDKTISCTLSCECEQLRGSRGQEAWPQLNWNTGT